MEQNSKTKRRVQKINRPRDSRGDLTRIDRLSHQGENSKYPAYKQTLFTERHGIEWRCVGFKRTPRLLWYLQFVCVGGEERARVKPVVRALTGNVLSIAWILLIFPGKS